MSVMDFDEDGSGVEKQTIIQTRQKVSSMRARTSNQRLSLTGNTLIHGIKHRLVYYYECFYFRK